MDKWDGQKFISQMHLSCYKSILEIGVGTGRIAVKTAPLCKEFTGIDISPKTIKRAKENLCSIPNITLICGNFMSYDFKRRFDVIYSSLTTMHIEDKFSAFIKIAGLLSNKGRFVLSADKNQSEFINTGNRRVKIYPDDPERTEIFIKNTGLLLENKFETEFAYIFTAVKK